MVTLLFPGDEVKVVSCPPFAESITEGDIRWEKGETLPDRSFKFKEAMQFYWYNKNIENRRKSINTVDSKIFV